MDPTAVVYTSLPHKMNAPFTTLSTPTPSNPFINAANHQFSNPTLPLAGPAPVFLLTYEGDRNSSALETKVPPPVPPKTASRKANSQGQAPVPNPRPNIRGNADSQPQVPFSEPATCMRGKADRADDVPHIPYGVSPNAAARRPISQLREIYGEPAAAPGRPMSQADEIYNVPHSRPARRPMSQLHEKDGMPSPLPPAPRRPMSQLHELDRVPPPLPPRKPMSKLHELDRVPPPPPPRRPMSLLNELDRVPPAPRRPMSQVDEIYSVPPSPESRRTDSPVYMKPDVPQGRHFPPNQFNFDSFQSAMPRSPTKRRPQRGLSTTYATIDESFEGSVTPSYDFDTAIVTSPTCANNSTSSSSGSNEDTIIKVSSSSNDDTMVNPSSPDIMFHPTMTSTPKRQMLLHPDATSSLSTEPISGVLAVHDPFFSSAKVFRLNTTNFTKFLTSTATTLVMFYDSKSSESRQYEQIVSLASCSTKRPNHAYAAVDCSKNMKLCMENQADILPMARLYSRTSCVGQLNTLATIGADVLRQLVESAPSVQSSRVQSCSRVNIPRL